MPCHGILILAPDSRYGKYIITLMKASCLDCSHIWENKVPSPPAMACHAAPYAPRNERDLTVRPCTTPKLRVMTCPGSSKAVVVIPGSTIGIASSPSSGMYKHTLHFCPLAQPHGLFVAGMPMLKH